MFLHFKGQGRNCIVHTKRDLQDIDLTVKASIQVGNAQGQQAALEGPGVRIMLQREKVVGLGAFHYTFVFNNFKERDDFEDALVIALTGNRNYYKINLPEIDVSKAKIANQQQVEEPAEDENKDGGSDTQH